MTLDTLRRWRVARQGVSAPLPTAAAVVRRLLAMQAQDLGQVAWAVASRCGDRKDALAAALASGEVVRTWPMRGTLHLVAREDARWMQRLLAARALRGLGKRREALGLDAATVSRAQHALLDGLADGRGATRDELLAMVEAAGVSTAGQRGYHLIATSAQEELLVGGPLRDGEPTFLRVDRWLPADPGPDGDEALARLAARYVDGHGPVVDADLAWWSGLPVTVCRRALAALPSVEFEGRRYAVPADDAAPPAPAVLVAGFDELHLGYAERDAILDPAHADRVCPGGNGVFRPSVLVDGRMVGTWKAKVGRRGVAVEVEPFAGTIAADLGPAIARYTSWRGAA